MQIGRNGALRSQQDAPCNPKCRANRPHEKCPATVANSRRVACKPTDDSMQSIFASFVYTFASSVYTYATCVYIFATCEYTLFTVTAGFICYVYGVGVRLTTIICQCHSRRQPGGRHKSNPPALHAVQCGGMRCGVAGRPGASIGLL